MLDTGLVGRERELETARALLNQSEGGRGLRRCASSRVKARCGACGSASWNDAARISRLRQERSFFEAGLARGLGLNGRPRRAASSAEKARVNVQRRIADAIRRVREASPLIGRHLEASVRTGLACCYQPKR